MPSPPPASVVLDTNTVLDWLVFRDPAALSLAAWIEAGRLDWRATPAMRQEFEHVLGRSALTRWTPDGPAAAATWDRLARVAPAEPPAGPLRCLDPDDQVFIDFALAQRCTWLISRDRALLRLARRATPWGLTILTPQAWSSQKSMSALTA